MRNFLSPGGDSARIRGLLLALMLFCLDAVAEDWNIHAQLTNVTQFHPDFTSPYQGSNSLQSGRRTDETTDATVFAGARLWRNAAVYADVEIDQGFGLSDTLGVAGFLSGEAYKVGASRPYWRVPRLFLRQSFASGESRNEVASAPNQLAGSESVDGLVITVGKFSAVDIFDTNTYAHDPRADFFNWAVIDAGAFDYPADAWGYTAGVALEANRGAFTWRMGLFNLSRVPNGRTTGADFDQFSAVSEIESRHQWGGHPGKLKLLVFLNRGRMGEYREAVNAALGTGAVSATAAVRRYDSRAGIALNAEQELTNSIGVFLRASANDGRKESYDFTEINSSIAAGVSFSGASWHRQHDQWAIAGVIDQLSPGGRAYFAAGGLGILIGDGKLPHPGSERIVETYYRLNVLRGLSASLDYQFVANPAYNRDRGPVSIFGLRLHGEF